MSPPQLNFELLMKHNCRHLSTRDFRLSSGLCCSIALNALWSAAASDCLGSVETRWARVEGSRGARRAANGFTGWIPGIPIHEGLPLLGAEDHGMDVTAWLRGL